MFYCDRDSVFFNAGGFRIFILEIHDNIGPSDLNKTDLCDENLEARYDNCHLILDFSHIILSTTISIKNKNRFI